MTASQSIGVRVLVLADNLDTVGSVFIILLETYTEVIAKHTSHYTQQHAACMDASCPGAIIEVLWLCSTDRFFSEFLEHCSCHIMWLCNDREKRGIFLAQE